ncbi:MAG: hypothetical protein KDA20_11870 [Phycisphaerales bacterium]|nr:hypothetical protein [Phycisphaerales bacterium]
MSVAPHFELERVFAKENTHTGASLARMGQGLLLIGAIFAAIAVVMGFSGDVERKALTLHALQVGAIVALSFPLGALGFSMILHAVNAGWWVLLRKQFENVFSLFWIGCLFVAGVFALQWIFTSGGGAAAAEHGAEAAHHTSAYLWHWMDPTYTAGDHLYEHKKVFLNLPFFVIRMVAYFVIWGAMVAFFLGQARRQEESGDPQPTVNMGRASCIGLVIFAVTTAFAAYDWMMSLDYHWFSTMFTVWFFASNVVSALALLSLIFVLLKTFGRAQGAITNEHLHDLGKLLFGFTVFWAYISFSQYFLIWYANIPEETMWFNLRRAEWTWLSWALPTCHFIVPFLLLIPKPARRSGMMLGFVAVWIIVVHLLDVFWQIRPQLRAVTHITIVDFLGVLGPACVFGGALMMRIASRPLIPKNDPRQDEALTHKNYV